MTEIEIQTARSEDLAEVASILDAAALQTDIERLDAALASSEILVAKPARERRSSKNEHPILGALVLDSNEITTIAVRPGRRGQGIGAELVSAAAKGRDKLLAEFDPDVRPFWDAVGFEIQEIPDADRLRGVKR